MPSPIIDCTHPVTAAAALQLSVAAHPYFQLRATTARIWHTSRTDAFLISVACSAKLPVTASTPLAHQAHTNQHPYCSPQCALFLPHCAVADVLAESSAQCLAAANTRPPSSTTAAPLKPGNGPGASALSSASVHSLHRNGRPLALRRQPCCACGLT
jgi:hypothetical protein